MGSGMPECSTVSALVSWRAKAAAAALEEAVELVAPGNMTHTKMNGSSGGGLQVAVTTGT